METILIFVFATLAVVFLALWLNARSLKDYSERLTNELRGINDTLNRVGYKVSSARNSTEEDSNDKPMTVESVRQALLYNGIPEDKIDMHDLKRIWFKIGETNFSVFVNDLPFLTFELGYQMNSEEKDLSIMEQAAQLVTDRMYVAKMYISPEEGYYACQADMIADSYLFLRDNFKRYIRLLDDACHRFNDEYKKLIQKKEEAAKNAINSALLAAPTDAAGNKIIS